MGEGKEGLAGSGRGSQIRIGRGIESGKEQGRREGMSWFECSVGQTYAVLLHTNRLVGVMSYVLHSRKAEL